MVKVWVVPLGILYYFFYLFSLSRWLLFLCHLTSFFLKRGKESALRASVKLSSCLSHLVHTPYLTNDDASWAFLKLRCPDRTESAELSYVQACQGPASGNKAPSVMNPVKF